MSGGTSDNHLTVSTRQIATVWRKQWSGYEVILFCEYYLNINYTRKDLLYSIVPVQFIEASRHKASETVMAKDMSTAETPCIPWSLLTYTAESSGC